MATYSLDYLKDIITPKQYDEILKNFAGCTFYISKKEYERRIIKGIYQDLKRHKVGKKQIIENLSTYKSKRTIYNYIQKGLFDE